MAGLNKIRTSPDHGTALILQERLRITTLLRSYLALDIYRSRIRYRNQ
jgi:4-hydroxy-L-threonine phosphate dehydrogenase PdxA